MLRDVLVGSAIVGFRLESDPTKIHVYYEGNAAASEAMLRFADRAKFAAGRCRWLRVDAEQWQRDHPGEAVADVEHGYIGYPTAAHEVVSADDLVEVALYDDVLGIVSLNGPHEATLLAAWIGTDDPGEFLATGAAFEQRRQDLQAIDEDGPVS